MAEGTGLILVDREIFVELLELPQELDLSHGGAGVDREAQPFGEGCRANAVISALTLSISVCKSAGSSPAGYGL